MPAGLADLVENRLAHLLRHLVELFIREFVQIGRIHDLAEVWVGVHWSLSLLTLQRRNTVQRAYRRTWLGLAGYC